MHTLGLPHVHPTHAPEIPLSYPELPQAYPTKRTKAHSEALKRIGVHFGALRCTKAH